MRYRLSGIATYRVNGLGKGDGHPAYVLQWSTAIYLYLYAKFIPAGCVA